MKMSVKFLRCVEFLLRHEGGYANDPADPGGETRFGISKRSFPNEDIYNLSLDRAKEIYFRWWWDKYGYEQINSELIAEKVLDLAVNMGQLQASAILQRALNVWNKGLDVDGKMGEKTIAALNSMHETETLYRAICHFAAQRYESLNNPRFIRGWLIRAFA